MEILKFEHKNGNSVRILELPELKKVYVQIKGPDTKWSISRRFNINAKRKYMKKFNETCKAIEHVTFLNR